MKADNRMYLEEHVPNSVRSCRRQRARNHAWHTLETDCVFKLLKVANDCREVDAEDRIDRTDTPLTSARVGAASVDRLRQRGHVAVRGRGRDTTRLLRDFDDRFFTANHSLDILQEDDRQRELDCQYERVAEKDPRTEPSIIVTVT